MAGFKQRITDTLATEELGFYHQLLEQYQLEHNIPALDIAAALAMLLQGDTPMLLSNRPVREKRPVSRDRDEKRFSEKGSRDKRSSEKRSGEKPAAKRPPRKSSELEKGMERYRIEVGHEHKVLPGNIVGAIANEAGLDSQYIGHINIQDSYSFIDLPEGMPKDVFRDLKKVWVSGRQLNISRLNDEKSSGKI